MDVFNYFLGMPICKSNLNFDYFYNLDLNGQIVRSKKKSNANRLHKLSKFGIFH